MTEWEKQVTKHLDDSEYHFLTEYDRWLKTAFTQIPIGGDEHVIHTFHLTAHQRLSSIVAKHSTMAFSMGQAAADADCKAIKDGAKKLADLPTVTLGTRGDFTPQDAIKVLRNRSITLAGDVENSLTSQVKEILLQHLTGQSVTDTHQQIADLLQSNMNRASLIVTTETTYAYNRGRLMSYQDNSVDYVMFRAVMDARTCGICGSRNGLIAPIGSIGMDTPPVHGRCRCVLSPVYSSLQSNLMTPEALDWSKVAPLPKGWVA